MIAENYAVGLAYVLATTDHLGLEVPSSVTVSGNSPLTESMSKSRDGTWTISGSTSGSGMSYTLAEQVDTPESRYTLTRTGALGVDEQESGTATFSSTLISSDAASLTQTGVYAAPDHNGTLSSTGSLSHSITQYGYLADYTWSGSVGASHTRTVTGTSMDGSYTAIDSESTSGNATGYYDGSSGPSSKTWTGSETSDNGETGNHGAIAYATSRSLTGGTVVGRETYTSATSYDRTVSHTGTYVLNDSQTFPGGQSSATGTETATRIEGGWGNDGGAVAFVDVTNYSSGETSAYTLVGVVTTGSGTESGTRTISTNGSEAGGTYTQSFGTGSTATTMATTNNQGVLSTATTTATQSHSQNVTGTIASGDYTLTGIDISTSTTTGTNTNQGVTGTFSGSANSTATMSQSGNRFNGTYSLHEVDTGGDGGTGNSTLQATATSGAVTGHRTINAGGTANDSGSATIDRTGNLISGTYSLHETGGGTSSELAKWHRPG